jgi:hypothetical protein
MTMYNYHFFLLFLELDYKKPEPIGPFDMCANYDVQYDPDRLWSYNSPTVRKCDADLYGKYRFGSKYTPWKIKEGCDKNKNLNTIHRCGAKYHGYMVGKHPIEKAGYVERVICFIEAKDTCECQYTATIGVQNCGGFYVYYFKGVPSPAVTSSDVLSLEDVSCSARYCMVANNSDSKLIIIYRYTPSYEHNGKLR